MKINLGIEDKIYTQSKENIIMFTKNKYNKNIFISDSVEIVKGQKTFVKSMISEFDNIEKVIFIESQGTYCEIYLGGKNKPQTILIKEADSIVLSVIERYSTELYEIPHFLKFSEINNDYIIKSNKVDFFVDVYNNEYSEKILNYFNEKIGKFAKKITVYFNDGYKLKNDGKHYIFKNNYRELEIPNKDVFHYDEFILLFFKDELIVLDKEKNLV